LRRARAPFRVRAAVIAAHGDRRLEAVTIARVDPEWRIVAGSERRVGCDLLAVGYGFTPQIELALTAGCAVTVGRDGSLAVAADSDGRTSVPGVYAAGETTGVGGSQLAIVTGRLCGAAVALDLGARPALDESARRRLTLVRRSLRRFAAALHDVHPVRDGWASWLDDGTPVCRCEEVPYVRVRAAVTELGAGDARTVKLLARPGMGWCQGRICASAVTSLVAQHTGRPVSREDLVSMSRRTLGNPVPLGQLAQLPADPGCRDPVGGEPESPHAGTSPGAGRR
jgi:NAD(P)H-nitrite reductase large subunit